MTTTRPPWRPLSAGVAAAGIVGVLCPLPSSAAPVPCAHPQRHAAEAGAEVLRLHRLDLRPTGRPGPAITDISIGEARSAMVAQNAISAAAARTLADRKPAPAGAVQPGGTAPAALTRAVRQQAPPGHPTATQAGTPVRRWGPLDLGEGSLTARARWDAAPGCGRADGEITRARAVLTQVGLLTDRSGRALLRMPQRVEARSTTALQRRGAAVHTVARAGVTGGTLEVLGGAVRVTIVKPPTLSTSISAAGAAEVRYVPAMLEVSGAGFGTIVLTTPGDQAELRLDEPEADTRPDGADPASGPDPGDADLTASGAVPVVPGEPLRRVLAGLPADELRPDGPRHGNPPAGRPAGTPPEPVHRPATGTPPEPVGDPTAGAPPEPVHRPATGTPPEPVDRPTAGAPPEPVGGPAADTTEVEETGAPAERPGSATSDGPTAGVATDGQLALPRVPDVPPLPGGGADEGPTESGDAHPMLRVTLGEVRQVVVGHAVAARVAALRVEITAGGAADPPAGAYAGGRPVRGGTVLDLDVGMLEAAAVAPEPAGAGAAADPAGGTGAGGTGAGLPVTGARVDLTVVAGAALLIIGLVCLVVGLRRRTFRT